MARAASLASKVALFAVLSLSPAMVHAADGGTDARVATPPPSGAGAQCWRPEALKANAAERMTRRGGPGARVRAPAIMAPEIAAPAMTPLSATQRGSIRRVDLPPGVKLVALTFDLCEANGEVTGYDGSVVDYLREHGVKATFFAGGKWLVTHAERAQQLVADPLFQIGNHSWSHRNMRKLPVADLLREITRTEAAYEHTRHDLAARSCMAQAPAAMTRVAERLSLFRFPYGTCNTDALQAVGDAGLAAIQWDVVTGDPAVGQSAERIARTVLKRVRPGSIIIAHANGKGRETARALPLFVPKLRAQGYRFVTVGELLAAGTPVFASSCYESRPGDNDRY